MRRLADKLVHLCADPVGDESFVADILMVCTFSAIGFVLSVRSLLEIDELPEILALL